MLYLPREFVLPVPTVASLPGFFFLSLITRPVSHFFSAEFAAPLKLGFTNFSERLVATLVVGSVVGLSEGDSEGDSDGDSDEVGDALVGDVVGLEVLPNGHSPSSAGRADAEAVLPPPQPMPALAFGSSSQKRSFPS